MRYFGSKTSVASQLFEIISDQGAGRSICDPFGGIGIVSSTFKQNGYEVWSGDLLAFPNYFQIARVENNLLPRFSKLLPILGLSTAHDLPRDINDLPPTAGWFSREYSEKRMFFTLDNGRKIEGARRAINSWIKKGLVTRRERATLLASLVNSVDKVANTAGTYYAYLKSWHRKALRPFCYTFIKPVKGNSNCRAFRCDAEVLVTKRHFHNLYLDPPYNSRSYPHYYHLPETLANATTCRPCGLAGVPSNVTGRSEFSSQHLALAALNRLLERASFDVLAFHYSDDGLMGPTEVSNTLSRFGSVDVYSLTAKGYTTESIVRAVRQKLYIVRP